MKRFMAVYGGLFVTLFCLSTPVVSLRSQTIYFDDSKSDTMILGNTTYYTIGLGKSSGAILFVTDEVAGDTVCLGSSMGILWVAEFTDPVFRYLSANDYGSGKPGSFAYSWSAGNNTLTLTYVPDATSPQRLTATVTVTLSAQQYFDMKITIQNDWGSPLKMLLFPHRLILRKSAIEEVLMPEQPGLLLKKGFFTSNRSPGQAFYPSGGRFANYYSVKFQKGRLTFYTLHKSAPLLPIDAGFIDEQSSPDVLLFVHDYPRLWVKNGDSWSSPTLRLTVASSYWETLLAYRTENGIDAYPSVQQKLGAKFDTLKIAPLFHTDPTLTRRTFQQTPELLKELPSPVILMLSNYWTGGFHGHHPDYIPPDTWVGTSADLRALYDSAHALGMLVAPFTLPIWWHENSPSVKNLPAPLTIKDIAVLDELGNPLYAFWELGGVLDWGYYVSPHHPYVQQRLQQLISQFTTDFPSDLIVEDVIGATSLDLDFNPSAPSPMAYSNWLNHTKTYKDVGLLTEVGYDLLTETEVGFFGSAHVAWDSFDEDYGAGNWSIYPLAPLLAHDKVLFYQYWADNSVGTEILCWNLALGFMLNHTLVDESACAGPCKAPIQSRWTNAIAVFQKHVAARFAGKRLSEYSQVTENVTKSVFEDIPVIRNWDKTTPYPAGLHTISPLGALVTSSSGDLIAGVFTAFNERTLTSGDHFLIVEPAADSIVVRQPIGPDTPLEIARPESWSDTAAIRVFAVGKKKTTEVQRSITTHGVMFSCDSYAGGDSVAYYKITCGTGTAVGNLDANVPTEFRLLQNYPNPFNPQTTIEYSIPRRSQVTLKIFNLLGEEVATVVNNSHEPGHYSVTWVGKNEAGAEVPSGIYICRLTMGSRNLATKMLILR